MMPMSASAHLLERLRWRRGRVFMTGIVVIQE
jgi:hypothetical protein